METGIPMSLLTPAGEVVLNDLTGLATSIAGVGGAVLPGGLPPGNGYLVTLVAGMDGGPVRNPVDNRPHAHGAVVHRFLRSGKVIRVEGRVVATRLEYKPVLEGWLADALDSILQVSLFAAVEERSRYFWVPPGRAPRFHTVHQYAPLEVVGPAASAGQSSSELSTPKTFTFSLVTARPEAWTYAQASTTVPAGTPTLVGNAGNTATWPVIRIYTGAPFTLYRDGAFEVGWDGPIEGSYIELNMHDRTMYWDGDGANALGGLAMAETDFWPLPPGGATLHLIGGSHALVLANDAWVS